MNHIFGENIEKSKFFKQTKRQEVLKSEKASPTRQTDIIEEEAMVSYSSSLTRDMEILQPSYIQFYPHLFLLSQQRISLQHAQALRKYLAGVKSIQDKLVYKLIDQFVN